MRQHAGATHLENRAHVGSEHHPISIFEEAALLMSSRAGHDHWRGMNSSASRHGAQRTSADHHSSGSSLPPLEIVDRNHNRFTEAAFEKNEHNNPGSIKPAERKHLIVSALKKTGTRVNSANINAIDTIVKHESSWNPHAVNHWDSNARKGIPSKGLMQTIGPTFKQRCLPGHHNIFNPLDNLIAGIRYAKSVYGSLQNVPGVRRIAHGKHYVGY